MAQPTLLGLPAELRNRIYRLVLVKDTHIAPQNQEHRNEERQALAITQINKQLRQEACEIYYSSNNFLFCHEHWKPGSPHVNLRKCLAAWCMAIGARNLTDVTSLSLEGICTRHRYAHRARSSCIRADLNFRKGTVLAVALKSGKPTCSVADWEAAMVVDLLLWVLNGSAEWMHTAFGRASLGRSLADTIGGICL